MKGNVVDMAVGVIVGGAFGKIVTSLVSDIMMPAVGVLCGGLNFTDWKWVVHEAVMDGEEVVKPEVAITWSNFLQVVFEFLIIALCIFLVVKAINKARDLRKKEESAAAAPAPKPDDVVLLEEIRDLLKEKK